MSMTDPIADMLTRIRNGQKAEKATVRIPASKVKKSILQVLTEQGYIGAVTEETMDGKPALNVVLKYYMEAPVIEKIERTSKPGRRVYSGSNSLPRVFGGYGIAVISTSKGIMTDGQARQQAVGGEILCTVY
ncbi:MAG TPA: 30S ribosomal protein S8 [Gammaproteobacteria bacterium]|nr:30S ribosomal protein S8 [Gammaproteobacteria bacterium]